MLLPLVLLRLGEPCSALHTYVPEPPDAFKDTVPPVPQNWFCDAVITGVEGCAKMVNTEELVALPVPVITVMVPVALAVGVAKIVLEFTTLKDAALIPPNCTAVVPLKFAPLIVTGTPGQPLLGIELMVGGGGHDTPETNVAPTEAPPYPTL